MAFALSRFADSGRVDLDSEYHYVVGTQDFGTRRVVEWMDHMITESDNTATRALIRRCPGPSADHRRLCTGR